MTKKQQEKPRVTVTAAAARPEVGRDWGEMVQSGAATLAKDWWEPEHAPGGGWFAWGGATAEISLPPLPRGTRLELDLMPHPGAAPLEILLNGNKVCQVDGNAPRQRHWLGEEMIAADTKNRLAFARAQGYVPSDRDPRPLSVQLFGVRAVGPGVSWVCDLAAEEERQRALVTATGVLNGEEFPEGRGVWTKPEAKLVLPAGPGTLAVTMWAPRPQPPTVEFSVRGTNVTGPLEVGCDPTRVEIAVTEAMVVKGLVELDLKATPFCPAKEGVSSDARELGVVLAQVRFSPAEPSP